MISRIFGINPPSTTKWRLLATRKHNADVRKKLKLFILLLAFIFWNIVSATWNEIGGLVKKTIFIARFQKRSQMTGIHPKQNPKDEKKQNNCNRKQKIFYDPFFVHKKDDLVFKSSRSSWVDDPTGLTLKKISRYLNRVRRNRPRKTRLR